MFAVVLLFATVWTGVFYGLLLALAALLVWCTLAEQDRWPFSCYPMFGVATEADAVRFFRLRVYLVGGTACGLHGLANALVDPLHREFEALWAAGPIGPAVAESTLLRWWRQACRLDESLATATKIELVLHLARLLPDGEIAVMEKSVHAVPVNGGAISG